MLLRCVVARLRAKTAFAVALVSLLLPLLRNASAADACDPAAPCALINKATTDLGALVSGSPPKLTRDEAAQVQKLIGQLANTESVDFPADAAIGLAKALTTVANKLAKPDPKNADLNTALSSLSTALGAVVTPDTRINVVGAWYGDIRDIGTGPSPPQSSSDMFHQILWTSRFCVATQAVRSTCQAKGTSCTIGAPGTALPSDTLCGFDPVPFASAHVKGLVVQYQCVKQLPSDWDLLEEALPSPVKDVEQHWAVLHSASGSTIRCGAQAP